MVNKIIYLAIFALLLAGCADSRDYRDYSDFKMPSDYDIETYEVETSYGYELKTAVINHSQQHNLYEAWLEKKERKEAQEEYNMLRSVIDNRQKMLEKEEQKLQDWCDSLHSNSCLEMEWLKDHNGCRKTEIKCEKYDTDDICIRYDIDVKEDLEDSDLC